MDPLNIFGPLSDRELIIAGATHWDLVRAENQAYDALRTAYFRLQIRHQVLIDHYSSHVNACSGRRSKYNDADHPFDHPLNSRRPTPEPELPSPLAIGDASANTEVVERPSILEQATAAIEKARAAKNTPTSSAKQSDPDSMKAKDVGGKLIN
ncbi:hypothetical protein CPC08DRAFT_720541 [Agrocybe pediades]|nr:hypothetical protein CPC08DRAFT_720541 [Agrocybe pediades]